MKQNQKKTHVIIIIYNYSFIIFIVKELEIKKINDIISKNIDRIRNASSTEAIKKLKPFAIKQKLKETEDVKRREKIIIILKKLIIKVLYIVILNGKKISNVHNILKRIYASFPVLNFMICIIGRP